MNKNKNKNKVKKKQTFRTASQSFAVKNKFALISIFNLLHLIRFSVKPRYLEYHVKVESRDFFLNFASGETKCRTSVNCFYEEPKEPYAIWRKNFFFTKSDVHCVLMPSFSVINYGISGQIATYTIYFLREKNVFT